MKDASEAGRVRVVVLGPDQDGVLCRVSPDVFDGPVRPQLSAEFLADPRHHLAVALDGDEVVGMASGVHYVHPDKDPELWINEVGVAPTHRDRGLARRLLEALFETGREAGCREAWVLTESGNAGARALYEAAGGVEPPDPAVLYSFDLAGS